MAAVPSVGRATQVDPARGAEAVAAERLYERHRARIFNVCLHYLRRRDDAEDAVQTTFLHAFQGLRRGVVPRTEAAWLVRIARNVCLSRCAAAQRRRRFEVADDPHTLETSFAAPEAVALEIEPLAEAISRLPRQQRQAILLREWKGLSYREIADELGVSVGAVEMLVFRGRRTLAQELRRTQARGHGFDLGSAFAALKSLLAGSAAKVAVTAAALTSAALVTGEALHQQTAPAPAAPARHPRAAKASATTTGNPIVAADARRAPAGRDGRGARAVGGTGVLLRTPRAAVPAGGTALPQLPSGGGSGSPAAGSTPGAASAGTAAAGPLGSGPSGSDPVSTVTGAAPVSVPDAPAVPTPTVTTPDVSAPSVTTPSLPDVPSTPDLPLP